MAILVKNQNSSEIIRISGIKVANGIIVPKKNKLGQRFIDAHADVLIVNTDADGAQTFTLRDGYELAASRKPKSDAAPKKPRAKKAATKKADAAPVDTETVIDDAAEIVVPHPTTKGTDDTDAASEQALIAAIKNLKGGAVDIKKVREIVAEEFARLAAEDPKKAAKVLAVVKKAASSSKEVYCEKFSRIVAKVSRGNNVYLYGPAGSGKSHTAEQVARELGLDFYGQTTIQFAHDVRGYGDAGGNFQETPFFKAFAHGGLYFQDEYDRSLAEAAIVLNTALANGWYDFPIVGRVVAHPNFRFMAAGNTTLTGASEEYITGQEIDPSCRDRFAYYFAVDYSHEVELTIAHGDVETVQFAEDVRQAIKQTGVKHVVSYRATAAMTDELENEKDREACIVEAVFKGLEVDERSVIYGALKHKQNPWAVALANTLK